MAHFAHLNSENKVMMVKLGVKTFIVENLGL